MTTATGSEPVVSNIAPQNIEWTDNSSAKHRLVIPDDAFELFSVANQYAFGRILTGNIVTVFKRLAELKLRLYYFAALKQTQSDEVDSLEKRIDFWRLTISEYEMFVLASAVNLAKVWDGLNTIHTARGNLQNALKLKFNLPAITIILPSETRPEEGVELRVVNTPRSLKEEDDKLAKVESTLLMLMDYCFQMMISYRGFVPSDQFYKVVGDQEEPDALLPEMDEESLHKAFTVISELIEKTSYRAGETGTERQRLHVPVETFLTDFMGSLQLRVDSLNWPDAPAPSDE